MIFCTIHCWCTRHSVFICDVSRELAQVHECSLPRGLHVVVPGTQSLLRRKNVLVMTGRRKQAGRLMFGAKSIIGREATAWVVRGSPCCQFRLASVRKYSDAYRAATAERQMEAKRMSSTKLHACPGRYRQFQPMCPALVV